MAQPLTITVQVEVRRTEAQAGTLQAMTLLYANVQAIDITYIDANGGESRSTIDLATGKLVIDDNGGMLQAEGE